MSSEHGDDGDGDVRLHDGGTGDAADAAEREAGSPEPVADGFGRAGWVLTAALILCVLVIPLIIYVYPYAAGSLGLTFFGTYLVLPLIPAVLLGLVAVWSMTAAAGNGE